MQSELLNYWQDDQLLEGYKAEDKEIVEEALNKVEDALFAFIMGLLY
jgi:hypothetical protein